ncbi:permease-like cell division protein FtsX [Streptosporangium sp. CA-135522]|uniref:permease-like cell division protein FtsX n=1 Tax=Streptosporangium sp. CA-135522 TaxID=3240072 RepID=UPI003D90AB4F
MLRVLLTLASMTVLLLGASAAEANRLPKILAPPNGPWPEGGRFSVFLCGEDDAWDACGNKEVTPAQRHAVEQGLRQIPRITELRFETKSESLAVMEAAPELAGVLEESDMAESFHGRLLRWSDAPAFDSAVQALPGVSNAVALPATFWQGKDDVVVTLCDAGGGRELCKGRQITADEKAAVEASLRRTRGVKRIYFEDRAHDMRMTEQFVALWSQVIERDPRDKDDEAERRSLEEYFESYHVKLDDPKLARSIVNAVKDLPGVAQVR